MHDGFSTSACAAAAACAAIQTISSKTRAASVSIRLLQKGPFSFPVCSVEQSGNVCRCGVIKDSGDDPDVTNGLEIQVSAEANPGGGIRIFGGEGVGVVSEPGLQVPVGEPAINPGSRRLIHRTVSEFCEAQHLPGDWDLTISVPKGVETALQTMNPQLGILGGISILGTDGIVHPYSISAWRASIGISLHYARENEYQTIAIVTGKRTEEAVRRDFPRAFVLNVGDDLEFPLSRLNSYPFDTIILGGMIEKLAKTAQGRFHTHVDYGGVDFDFLAGLASSAGASPSTVARLRSAVTAHQVQNLLAEEGLRIEQEICNLTAVQLAARLGGKVNVQVILNALDGRQLGNTRIEAEA